MRLACCTRLRSTPWHVCLVQALGSTVVDLFQLVVTVVHCACRLDQWGLRGIVWVFVGVRGGYGLQGMGLVFAGGVVDQ
jgi:hypothetical protein